ncbi:MAG: hypothetical protein M4579_000427 [Chaenotheca gracillima]|nr:MAG: hypothetical protein M4579_000427 [Chaenotheca gracillima]
MAFIHETDLPWHAGEDKMHDLLRVPRQENPTSPFLTPGAGYMLMKAPLLALGTLDKQGRPWTTIWGGEPGFSRPIGNSIIGVKALVDRQFDPVMKELLGADGGEDGDVVSAGGNGKMVGALAIDLETRKRVKIYGRMAAGAVGKYGNSTEDNGLGEVQMVVRVEQSLGNCPKYLNRKAISPYIPKPKLNSSQLPLPQRAVDILSRSDLFFISSSDHEHDMDTNHRGGPPGFTRVLSNTLQEGTVLVYPEYSGNRLYQTLGNLQTTPLAGLVFPDFESGDVLYVTGTTQIFVGADAAQLLPHTNIAVKVRLTDARLVENGLPFRGKPGELSPYNPTVRYLRTEKASLDGNQANGDDELKATLISNEPITPTISRYRFRLHDTKRALPTWKAGQYAAFSFEEELSMGYSHMRDDDPKSLNDDFIRTFTVSSPPPAASASMGTIEPDEFEITIRKVGIATNFLARQRPQAGLELPLRGFGGEFFFSHSPGEMLPVVAGGIGITPLLAQISSLDLSRLQLFWAVRAEDIRLVTDVLGRYPALGSSTSLFVTGDRESGGKVWTPELIEKLASQVVVLRERRMEKEDLLPPSTPSDAEQHQHYLAEKWYVCASTELRKSVTEWLREHERINVVYEDFSY